MKDDKQNLNLFAWGASVALLIKLFQIKKNKTLKYYNFTLMLLSVSVTLGGEEQDGLENWYHRLEFLRNMVINMSQSHT